MTEAEAGEEKKGGDKKNEPEEKNLIYHNPFDFKETRKFQSKWEEYRYGDWRKKHSKTYVTLETEIPELPTTKIEAPDEAAFHKRLAEIDNKVKDLRNELNDQKAKFSDFVEQKKATGQASTEVPVQKVVNKGERLKQLKRQKDKIHNEAGQFDEEKLELGRKKDICMKKIDRKYGNEEAVLKGLKELKKKFESSSGTAKEEQAFLKQEKMMKESIPFIKELDQINSRLKEIDDTVKKIKKDLPAIFQELKELNQLMDEERKNRDEKHENLENLNKQIDKVQEKRKRIFDEIDKLKKQKEEMQDKYYGQMIDYTKYQFLVSDIKWMTEVQQKLRERDEEKKKREQERLERLERIRKEKEERKQRELEKKQREEERRLKEIERKKREEEEAR